MQASSTRRITFSQYDCNQTRTPSIIRGSPRYIFQHQILNLIDNPTNPGTSSSYPQKSLTVTKMSGPLNPTFVKSKVVFLSHIVARLDIGDRVSVDALLEWLLCIYTDSASYIKDLQLVPVQASIYLGGGIQALGMWHISGSVIAFGARLPAQTKDRAGRTSTILTHI